MNRLILFTLIMLAFPVSASAVVTDLVLSVDTSGKIAAEVNFQPAAPKTKRTNPSFDLYVVALPFRIAELAKIQSPEDVPVAILKRGDGFTLISAAIPSSRTQTLLRISDAFSLSESPEGKALLELDLSYQFLSQADRPLLNDSFSLLPNRISITLPREYEEIEIGLRPVEFKRINGKQYVLDVGLLGPSPSKAWLVFPNPMKNQLQIAKIVLATVIGLFTLLFHVPALKEQRLSWSLTVLVVSSLIFGLILYYSHTLSKRLDFVEWAAGSIPHILYGLASSIYLAFIARRQCLITGRVTLDGQPIQIAEVQLWRIDKGERQQIKLLDTLANEGRYSFRAWPKNHEEKFEVTAAARGTDEVKSGEFQIEAGKRIEIIAIDLHWRQQVLQSSGDKQGAV